MTQNTYEIFLDPESELFPQATADIDAATLGESYRRLQIIYGLGRAICGETELGRVLNVVIEALTRLIHLERCFIATFDGAGRLQALATHNIKLPADQNYWPLSKTMINLVVKEG